METICLSTINWSAISSIIMALTALAATISLIQNRKQLNVIKTQWKEDNRARLNFSIIVNDGLFLLKISNIGKETAYNIKLSIVSEIIDNHYSADIKKVYEKLQEKPIAIEAGVSKYFYISRINDTNLATIQIGNEVFNNDSINKWIDNNKDKPLNIIGRYCDQYDIKDSFCISDFIMDGSMLPKNELVASIQEIKKGLVINNGQYMPIQKSLDTIVKAIRQASKIDTES
ncbi:MAG: hypothetical protein NC396_02540 [Bacteroides sp.]|nr:hypothetical protein [Bacteroides sp.]MCM1085069.1 hypothetical protein [Bacteroides sp.]